MVILAIVLLRLMMGLLLGSSLAAAGYFVGTWIVPGHILTGLKIVLMVGAGTGASIGAGLSWAAYLTDRRISLQASLLAVVGGFLGALGGYYYACAVYECDVVPRQTIVTVTVLAAAFAANLLAGPMVSIWTIRHGRY